MPAHEAHAGLQILLHRLFGQLDHLPGGRAVNADGLLHEDVQALFDGVFEMHPPEGDRRGEDHDVSRLQAIHRLSVGFKAEEAALRGHIHLRGTHARNAAFDSGFRLPGRAFQRLVADGQALREHIGHGDEPGGSGLGGEGIGGGARPAPAAANQRDLDGVVPGGIARKRHGGS